jgi:hypothetical protein
MVFEQIAPVEDMSSMIEEVFGVKLDISGGWGYDNKSAVKVHSLEMPIDQFLHTFAAIRANIEMNLTQEEDDRFGGINVHFMDGQQFEIEHHMYDHITFEITAMKEKEYAAFIQEYKDNYGKNKDFDMSDHFKRREDATISREADYWFEGLEDYYHEDDTNPAV